jgi:endonuclease-3 related protein
MVGAILTQNTNWKNVEKAIESLGEDCNPESILNMDLDALALKIRPSGYHNQKAKKLKNLAAWLKEYNYDLEVIKKTEKQALREALLSIKGVGPETADDMLVYVFDKTSFVIDTYSRRLFSRIGFEVPIKYTEFQKLIESQIPRKVEVYNEFHGLIVIHAKEYCKKSPSCEGCPLTKLCLKVF